MVGGRERMTTDQERVKVKEVNEVDLYSAFIVIPRIVTHVTAVVRACFAALRQIRSVRRSLSRHALLTLVRALIVSKVDYCNSVLAGIPGQLQDRLQSVLNAAARLVFLNPHHTSHVPTTSSKNWVDAVRTLYNVV